MSFETANVELLNIEEFNEYNFNQKCNKIKQYWGIKENLIQGTITLIDNKNINIEFIKSLDGKKVLSNPFTGESLSISVSTSFHEIDIDRMELFDGEDVIFEFIPKGKINNPNWILNIKKNTILQISKIKDVYKEIGIESSELEELVEVKVLHTFNQDLKKNNEELKENISNIEKDTKIKSQQLHEINKLIELSKQEEERLIKLGLLNSKEKIDKVKEKLDMNRNEYIDYIIKYLACSYRDNLYYNESTIERLYTALSTSQLVILSGSPGTGKTSLIEGFSDAIGANKKIISAQPNWTETQDLIGFYNPIDKKYISTPFLDFLVDAKNDEDRLYIVCLDEMNLAHVEYYFAEFLSKLESKDRELELYSEEVYTKTKEEIESQMKFIENKYKIINEEDIFNIEDMSIFEKYNQLKSQYQNLLKYNHKLTIPKNIRFVGTINKDETTKNLSPKVVDRSFIMEVEKYSEETKKHMIENMNEYKENYSKVLNLGYEDFKVNKVDINEEILNELNNISNIVNKEFNISLNNRFYKQVEEIISVGMLREEEILDSIILTKIIPKINVYIESDNEEKIHKFEEAIKDKPNSMMVFNKMKLGWQDTEVLTFWR